MRFPWILRTTLIAGAIVGAAWASVTVPLGGRTAWQHLRASGAKEKLEQAWSGVAWSAQRLWTRWGDPERPTSEPKRAVKGPTKAKSPQKSLEVATRRVAILQAAREDVERTDENAPAKSAKTTRIDERISEHQEKAFDALVTSRVLER